MSTTIETMALQKRARTLETLAGIMIAIGAIWLLNELYVPLKQLGAALMGNPDLQVADALVGILRAIPQALPTIALIVALWHARLLFTAFHQGQFLTTDNCHRLGLVGSWLMGAGIISFVGLDGSGATGYFPSFALAVGFVGFAIRYIADIWRLATDLKAEHDQII